MGESSRKTIGLLPRKYHPGGAGADGRRGSSLVLLVVRLTPKSRPQCGRADRSLSCHVWTTPAVQEENLTFQRAGRVQPCIRPLNAAALAAGPDVIPGLGPNQKHAFLPRMALVAGLPIDGFDRFASMSSSPLQFLNALTQPHTTIGKLLLTLPQTKQIDRSYR